MSNVLRSIQTYLRELFQRGRRVGRKPPPRPRISREGVERLVGMQVEDMSVYEQALLHRSVLRGEPDSHLLSNERLEFLGDAVLGFVTAEHLFLEFPEKDEGFLTRLRAKIVNGEALAEFAMQIGLGAHILLSDNMDHSGGRENPTILADAFEALIGAIYLDQGEAAARMFIRENVLEELDLEDLAHQRDNYKSLLLEHVQAMGWPQPQYRVMREEGPSHDRTFTVEVLLNDRPYGRGEARSKKKAEQAAASEAILRLRLEES